MEERAEVSRVVTEKETVNVISRVEHTACGVEGSEAHTDSHFRSFLTQLTVLGFPTQVPEKEKSVFIKEIFSFTKFPVLSLDCQN